jgi:hypothetical protein
LLVSNHRSNSAVDTAARDSAIAFSIAVQHGADPKTIRSALCRNSNGKASVGITCRPAIETKSANDAAPRTADDGLDIPEFLRRTAP